MSAAHQSSEPLFSVGPGEVRQLRLHDAHQLRVQHGRLWLTLDGSLLAPSEDWVLQAGDSRLLPAGRRVLVEALPLAGQRSAGFELLLAP